MKNILVIGATSAIAIACSRLWAVEDAAFFLVGRKADRLQQTADDLSTRGASAVHTHVVDLNELDKHEKLIELCFSELGKIDVALIAYGTLPNQQACEQDVDETIRAFYSNGLSVIALLTLIANKMEVQAEGSIIVISSVAGDRGRFSNYVYGSAKAAVSAFCEGLRARLFNAGVHVLTIKPGFVDTPMTKNLSFPKFLVASPEKVAGDIVTAVSKKKNVIYTPWFWRFIMFVIVHIPGFVFKRLKL